MFVRKSLIVLATIAATSTAFAGDFSNAHNELGFTGHPTVSTKSRAEVAQEAQAFAANSVAAAGLQNQGEAGLVPVYAKTNSAKPSTMLTASEKRLQREIYVGYTGA